MDKTFIVTHGRARAPIAVTGKNLEEALINEGLDPSIWHEVPQAPPAEVSADGDNQGDASQEDN